jgi:dienelactone hydrolase
MAGTNRLAGLICAAAVSAAAWPASAQPGFGKPRPRPAQPAPAAPDPAPGDGAADPLLGSTANPAAPTWREWRDEDPERKAPTADAEPGRAFAWKSRDGLRYTWSLPREFKKGQAYDLVILCHPDRSDFRWGYLNHPAGAGPRAFRPGDIVIAVDGTSAHERNPDVRTFEIDPDSLVRFRDLVLEVSRVFPTQRIYLYGMGGGGAFAQCFAARFPALADGVVAHGCGVPTDCARKGDMPVVLLHGAKDLMVPVNASREAARAYRAADHANVRVRVLQSFNDFPNPVRAAECIDYLKAVRTDDAAEALAAARALLTPKPPDEYEYRCAVWFGAAREALGRLVGEGSKPIENVPAETAAAARALIERVEAEGARHVAALRAMMAGGPLAEQPLDGKPWLGYLVGVREDFRGVKSVEAFAAEIGYDELAEEHHENAVTLREVWTPDGDVREAFETGVQGVLDAWLSDGLPLDIGARLRFWSRRAEEHKLPADAMEKYEYVANWEKGWKTGLEAYEAEWRKWKPE